MYEFEKTIIITGRKHDGRAARLQVRRLGRNAASRCDLLTGIEMTIKINEYPSY
jgi:hypothetical protein